MTDLHDILVRAKSGDDQAFSELFNVTINKMIAFTHSLTSNQDVIDDVVQSAYVSAFKHINSLKDDNFIPWMWVIIKRKYFDYIKQAYEKHNSNEASLSFDTLDDKTALNIVDQCEKYRPDVASSKEDVRHLLFKVLDQLPQEQREVIALCYFDGMKQAEVAEMMDISLNTVKSRLKYGMDKVKTIITEIEAREGVRYHAIAPMPLLVWLYRQYIESVEIAPYTNIGAATAAAGSVVATATTSTAKTVTDNAVAEGGKIVAQKTVKVSSNVAKSATKVVASASTKVASTSAAGLSVGAKIGISVLAATTVGTVAYNSGVIDPIIEPIADKINTENTTIDVSVHTNPPIVEIPTQTAVPTATPVPKYDDPYNPFDNMPYLDVDWFEGHDVHFVRDTDGKIYVDVLAPGDTYTQDQIDAVKRYNVFFEWFDNLTLKYYENIPIDLGVGGDFGPTYFALSQDIFEIFKGYDSSLNPIYSEPVPEISETKSDEELAIARIATYGYGSSTTYGNNLYSDEYIFSFVGCNIISGQKNGDLVEGEEVTIQCKNSNFYKKFLNVNVDTTKTFTVQNIEDINVLYKDYPNTVGWITDHEYDMEKYESHKQYVAQCNPDFNSYYLKEE